MGNTTNSAGGDASPLPPPPLNRRQSSDCLAFDDTKPPRPPYIDPETGFEYDTNHADSEGWLSKQSSWVKEWRVRYFILKGSMLFFAKSQEHEPHGMIDLTDCTKVTCDVENNQPSLDFVLSSINETYNLRANNRRELDTWVPLLRGAIKASLSAADYNEQYKELLYKGQMFVKHHHDPVGRFNLSNKDNHRLIRVSPDGQRVMWHKAGKTDVYCDSIDLNTVVAINPGYTTLVFKQTGKKGMERNCFSIISSDRSLDLEAPSSEIARKWIEGLRALLKYGHILTPSELRAEDARNEAKVAREEVRKKKALGKHEDNRAKLRAARERANHMQKR